MLRFLCYALRLKFSLCAQGNSFFNLFIFDSLPSHIKNIWRFPLSLSRFWVGGLIAQIFCVHTRKHFNMYLAFYSCPRNVISILVFDYK